MKLVKRNGSTTEFHNLSIVCSVYMSCVPLKTLHQQERKNKLRHMHCEIHQLWLMRERERHKSTFHINNASFLLHHATAKWIQIVHAHWSKRCKAKVHFSHHLSWSLYIIHIFSAKRFLQSYPIFSYIIKSLFSLFLLWAVCCNKR